MSNKKPQDIKERTFNFAVRIITLVERLPHSRSTPAVANQLLRAGTSVGANVEEATAAYSKDDFIYRMDIALREARETHYWLRVIQASKIIAASRLEAIIQEAEEIKKILGAIVSKSRGKRK